MDLQDKQAWCDLGELEEGNFLERQDFHLVHVLPNVTKDVDKYAHDMRISFPADLKTIRSSWRKSQELFGIQPKYAISINKKDVDRYNDLYPNMIIILDIEIEYINENDGGLSVYKTVRWVDMTRINRLIKSGFAKEHQYKERTEDTQGNAKSSYVFDCRWFPVLKENDGR